MLDRRIACAAGQRRVPKCIIRASPGRSDQGERSGRLMVVLPELCVMLPDRPDHAKGRVSVAAKKVCKLVYRGPRHLQPPCELVRGLQGLSAVATCLKRDIR